MAYHRLANAFLRAACRRHQQISGVPLVQGRWVGATWKPPLRPSSWLRMNDLPCSTWPIPDTRESCDLLCGGWHLHKTKKCDGVALPPTCRARPHTATTPTGPRVCLSTRSASAPSSNFPVP